MHCASRNPRVPSEYASESYQHAVQLMDQADEYATRKHIDKKPLIAVAREAVQTAEDARAIAVKKMDEDAPGKRASGFSRCTGKIAGAG